MPVITLTTDWGTTDHYVGAMKGELLSACPGASLVDITHQVPSFDIAQGAYLFRNAWHHFPKGTVHIVGVEAETSTPDMLIVLEHENHFFVGSDSGFFSLAFDVLPGRGCFVLDSRGQKVLPDIRSLASSAAFLANGGKLDKMGTLTDSFKQKTRLHPVTEDESVKGLVIYTDGFGNLVTNIHRDLVNQASRNRTYEVVLRGHQYSVPASSSGYHQAGRGELVARFNEAGFLEISVAFGNASMLLGIRNGDPVRIEFK